MIRRIWICLFLVCCYGMDHEVVSFSSANPFSFYHVITDLENLERQEVTGILRFPEESGSAPYPLVMGVAGSKGWSEHHLQYMEMYRDLGMATFELQSFKSRNVTSTVGEQISVTHAMMILDAYRALETLSTDPRIDADRTAITGWSLGGGVTLFSAWQPLKRAITEKVSFAAHLAFYPPCFTKPDVLDFTDAPIHILIGELDNWTPAAACEELVSEMQSAGVNVDLTVYPDSHHSFDRIAPPVVDEKGYSLTDCRFNMRVDGAVLMNFLDIPMITPTRQKIALAFCADRGPTYGGNPVYRKAAFEFAKNFMSEHLLTLE
ncbi:MAG: dienelactone hydrolase family protein [Candidatus Marinimicrobia bacterium]|nr:dienelactone hydrolase family protein [Candidatus Neomarinimicrobiota bacterium]MDP7437598.1 dienelactone hydrolase family protein [Candidatus Neomarinimicrobiota bacterium]HJL74198.1 dienelactone hydrolase family protein [Candidatus Neomarinimicrobiota bacterium]